MVTATLIPILLLVGISLAVPQTNPLVWSTYEYDTNSLKTRDEAGDGLQTHWEVREDDLHNNLENAVEDWWVEDGSGGTRRPELVLDRVLLVLAKDLM